MRSASPPRSIALSKLQPGDVLLSRGLGDLSDLICEVDGGSYSHAALWDGERAIEATLGGVHANPIEHALRSQRYVDVYRFHREGGWLGTEGWPAEPVVEQARRLVGGRFAYADLLLAAVVVALGRPTTAAAMNLALCRLGGHAGHYHASKLFTPMDSPTDAQTSTQVVAAAYHTAPAAPEHRYALDVCRRDGRAAGSGRDRESAELEADYLELSLQWRLRVRTGAPALADAIERIVHAGADGPVERGVRAGARALAVCCVTPRDLEQSASLERLGRLSERPGAH